MKYKNINFVIDYIYNIAPLQKKKIEEYLSNRNNEFMEEFELFLIQYCSYLNHNNVSLKYGIDAYLKMCNDMFKCQIKFMRSGKYPISLSDEAYRDVYSNKSQMLSYMVGLALSQYLWDTHYQMFSHLREELSKNRNKIKNYLEIGPGHGLFLKSALDILNNDVSMTAVDISPISMDISKSIIDYFYPKKNVRFINQDMLKLDLDSQCDFIVMGEVIEHVQKPQLLLRKINKLLGENGIAFLSTCVNCPAIDHVYHFKTIEEIREMFKNCGLDIYSERVLPVENLDMKEVIKQKVTINYSAIVKRIKDDE
jgi:2-polyprenyl-3-methyl-5-hydroxy-6-metoxy-1,4-benzoquinol methylase